MIADHDLVVDGAAIYLPSFYQAERGTAARLAALAAAPASVRGPLPGIPELDGLSAGVDYDDVQRRAILTALRSKVFILTGGPGTGKTTTTQGILAGFRAAGAKILLAAPTGRAARRLSEAAGAEAKTLHRLLEAKPPAGFQRGPDNPLEGDVLIVDECSMIDLMLMYSLLKALPDSMTLILVGDVDQLPSVGAGNVLRDLIDSGRFAVTRLNRVFRQAQKSRIITNAHRVNSGQFPDISNGRNTDFFFLERNDPEAAAGTIVELVKTKLPRYYRLPPAEIQVLTPMQRGVVGAANLNAVLQEAVNPGGPGLQRAGRSFRARDKVMQIRNNYEKEVFNGDIGVVDSVNPREGELTVLFEDRLVDYDWAELDELVLAYAATIHKSQGSEYPVVVLPLLTTHYIMLQRNLLYTGITRAKRGLILVGQKKALALAVRNTTAHVRSTLLRERIRAALPENAGAPGLFSY